MPTGTGIIHGGFQAARADMYFIYSLIFSIGILLTAPYYLWRLRGKQPPGTWRERFGRLPQHLEQSRGESIWIHAVSVGETLAAISLVERLQAEYPKRGVFLSHVTVAGLEASASRLSSVAGRFSSRSTGSSRCGGPLGR